MELYKYTYPKARKGHKCEYCRGVIQKGDYYSHEKGKHEGEFFERKLCVGCASILDAYLKDTGETEFDWYLVDGWLREECCSSCQYRGVCHHDTPAACGYVKDSYADEYREEP